MNKASRLRRDHREWETGGFPSHELLVYQDNILMKELHCCGDGKHVAAKELFEAIASRHPAKNGFITVHDYETWSTYKSHVQPEDQRKTEMQREQISLKCSVPLERVRYHPYGKDVRTVRMTGTFTDNERIPMPGQKAWLRPGVSGTVVRVGLSTLSLMNFVDMRLDANNKVMSFDPAFLFDHEPEVVTYLGEDGQKVEVWE